MGGTAPTTTDPRLQSLAGLDSAGRRRAYLAEHPELANPAVVEQLTEQVRQLLRVDVDAALRWAEAALTIADALGAGESLARALRAKANALWFQGQCRPAVDLLDRALELFEQAERPDELGRTLSTSIQPLILLGEYDRALRHAERAREIFSRQNDALRLARLDINVANIHHRQERFEDALAAYERAYEQLLPQRDTEGIGVALHNMAVCLISLDEFDRALKIYEQARDFFREQEMPLLLAQADYNIAYLYYLRGDYQTAIEGLRATRQACATSGDAYHAALCELDLSEIYLELNLVHEAGEAAREAVGRFDALGMGYESARALTNLGVAGSRKGDRIGAIECLGRARTLFTKEGHRAGESLVDLYRAILLFETGDSASAKPLCLSAQDFFRRSGLVRKAVICDLLLAGIALAEGDPALAQRHCQAAVEQLASLDAPVLSYQAYVQLGRVHEASGDAEQSFQAYQAARQWLETLRSSLQGEELQIAFIRNKLEVYEQLVRLSMTRGLTGPPAEDAFRFIEQAKCRSLVDAIFGRAGPLATRVAGELQLEAGVRRLRGELNWFYHRIEREQLRPEGVPAERVARLWTEARAREDALLRIVRERPGAALQKQEPDASAVTLEEIRAALDPDTVLVEYFQTGHEILAAVLTNGAVEIVPLTTARRVRDRLRMLQLQLSKFRFGPAYTAGLERAGRLATDRHLQELYGELIAPLDSALAKSHVVFVPHGLLHHVPLHALHDGSAYVIDRLTVSYVPSASLYAFDRGGPCSGGRSLVFGIRDSKAPWILQEAREVAAVVPNAHLLTGEAASHASLREFGPRSGLIHIATHGFFRSDNPMFSAVRLADSYLNVYDLYSLRLPVDLFTLSGCATGLSVVDAGDEMMGLARGLLYSGARTLLLTLWEVHDRSTAEFMRLFYRQLHTLGKTKVLALQTAMLELRNQYPHPFHWAPFILVGAAT